MEIKWEPNQCRLCFLSADDYINILEKTAHVTELLEQYFHDEVTETDLLPKIICNDCWDRINEFRKFSQKVVTLREEYLQQHLNSRLKREEDETANDARENHDESVNSAPESPMALLEPMDEMEFCEEKVFESIVFNEQTIFDGNDDANVCMDDDDDDLSNDSNNENEHDNWNESVDDPVDTNIMHEKFTENMLLPRHISDVSYVQRQAVINEHFDMTCDHCDAKFQDFYAAIDHYKEIHKNPNGYVKCCGYKYKLRKKVFDHILWHLNPDVFTCNICGLRYKSRQSYSVHKHIHKANVTMKYLCDICQKRFGRREAMRTHILSVHASKLKFQCEHCRESFKSQQHLDGHINIAHNESYIDSVDDIRLTPEETAKVISEHFDMSCTQSDCRVTFESLKEALQHHIDIHGVEGYVRCCQSRFNRQRLIDEHIAWHLNPDIFRCNKCWKPFKSRVPLKRHLIMHEAKGIVCLKCKLGFRKRSTYNAHMRQHHKKEVLLQCDHCEKTFAQKFNLIEHIKVIHEPEFEAQRKRAEETELLLKFFDMKCDWDGCEVVFDSLEMAQSHYLKKHKTTDFYIKCCDLKFKEASLVKDHLAWHENPDVFKCIQCNESLINRKQLHYHTFKHRYRNVKRFTCDICQKRFLLKSGLRDHIMESHVKRRKKCTICGEQFPTRDHLEEHLSAVHVKNSDDLINEVKALAKFLTEERIKEIIDTHFEKKCDFCDIQLDTFSSAQQHYLNEHKIRDGYLKCCNLKLKSPKVVSDHAHWHQDPNTFKCRLCQTVRRSRASLKSHMMEHPAVQMKRGQFICTICKRAYAKLEFYNKHMKSKHPQSNQTESSTVENDGTIETENVILCDEPSVDETKTEIIEYPDYFDMTCSKCPTIFTSLDDAKEHYLKSHGIRTGFLLCCQIKLKSISDIKDHTNWHVNPDLFRCKICKKTFGNRRLLKHHSFNHTRKFVCYICGKGHANNHTLRTHLKTHEKRERNYMCDICNKGFYSDKYLKGHIERKHSSEQTHMCEFCAKGFNTKTQLTGHLKTHAEPTEKKPKQKYQCEICKTWYNGLGSFTTHMLRHNSEPQKCDQCDKISPNKAALYCHIRAVHCESNYKCHLCDKSFKLAATLEGHIATHQDNRIFKCTYCEDTFTWRPNMYKHRKKMHEKEWLADKALKLGPT